MSRRWELSMTRAVIAGGGFAGLAGALFMARRGHSVTLVERDPGPPGGTPDDDADRWRHPGVSQARQSHAMLGRARRVLVDEAPDVLHALLARGVHEVPIVFGAGTLEGERMLLSRRLVAEAELRRIVAREPGITLIVGDAVAGLQVKTAGAVPVVTGVELRSGASVAADLVVDASGRRSALPDWFARPGCAHRSTSGRTAGSSTSLGTTGCDRGVRHRRAGSPPRSPSTTHRCSRSVRTTTRSR